MRHLRRCCPCNVHSAISPGELLPDVLDAEIWDWGVVMKLPTSLRWQRDPMMTSGIIKSYRAKINASIKDYHNAVKSALTRSKTFAAPIEPTPIDMQIFSSEVYQAGLNMITMRGEEYVPMFVEKAYRAGIIHASNMIKLKGIDASLGMGPADWRAIDSLEVRNLSALRGISDEMSKQIIREVQEGMNRGESMTAIKRRIAGRVNSIGMNRADLMARTEVMYAANDGAIKRYSQEGVEKWQWYTTQDDRLCPQCRPKHNQIYAIGGSQQPPPLHPRCRCVALPYFED